jgi:hypothetical protein
MDPKKQTNKKTPLKQTKSDSTKYKEQRLSEIKAQKNYLKVNSLSDTAVNRKKYQDNKGFIGPVNTGSGSGSTGRGGGNTKPATKTPTSSSGSNSKLAALNTQKRRDQYTQRGWAQDATTKLKSAPATKPSTSKTPTIQGDGSKTVTKKPTYLGTIPRASSIGSLDVRDNKALVSNPVPTVGTPKKEQRKVKKAERKAKRDEKRESRSLKRENKKATRKATQETNQARKAVKKSLKKLGGTRKEIIAQKNNEFEAGKPKASTVAAKGLNNIKDSYGSKPTVSEQSKIPSVNRGLKPEPLTDFLSSSNSRDNKTFGVLQSDERTGGSESMRGKYFGSEKMQAAQRKFDADNPLSMKSPVKMGQTMQGVAPVQNNPYQDVNQMNYNFDPLSQQRAKQMQMPNQQSPMFKKDFPDLNKDGKITKADILIGRGVKK